MVVVSASGSGSNVADEGGSAQPMEKTGTRRSLSGPFPLAGDHDIQYYSINGGGVGRF